MNNKEITLNAIKKPKIRVIKKVIKKRPVAPKSNDDDETNRLNEKLENLNLNNNNTQQQPPQPNVQKKADIFKRTIREKVQCDKLSYNAQMELIEASSVTENELKTHYYDLFQPEHYKDVVAERSTAGKCGYPCCDHNLADSKKLNQKYLISIKEQKIYNVEELSMFCSSDCLIKSKLYSASLDVTAVYLRKIESKKITPTTETTNTTTTTTTQTNNNTTITTTTTAEPMEILNRFEKSLVITEKEDASLIPPDLVFGNKGDTSTISATIPPPKPKTAKPIIKASTKKETTTTTTKGEQLNNTTAATATATKKKTILTNDIPILKKNDKNIIKDSDEEDDSDDDDDDHDEFSDYGSSYGDEQDEGPMILNDEDEEEDGTEDVDVDIDSVQDDELSNKSDGDKSEDEFSLFRPSTISTKKITELFKPSNYHIVYSALSQFTTKHTNTLLQHNQVNYEYILEQNVQIKNNLHTQLSLVYQNVLDSLCFKNTTGRDKVTMLIDTFRFDKPVPSLKRNHWKILSLIDKEILIDIQNNYERFENLVKECSFDMETFKVFQNLLVNGYD